MAIEKVRMTITSYEIKKISGFKNKTIIMNPYLYPHHYMICPDNEGKGCQLSIVKGNEKIAS